MTTELIAVENLNALEIFSKPDGLDPLIDQIEKEVRAFIPDVSTESGRKEIASVAYKVARSKTALDNMGKELTEEWKKQAKLVDASRRKVRERLDALKDEVRAPLTEFENREKDRIAKHENEIQEITSAGLYTAENWNILNVEQMRDRLKEIESIDIESFEEFSMRAKMAKEQAIINIKHGITSRKAYEQAQAEVEARRLQEQKAREEQIAKEAAEKAKREAEEQARHDRVAAEKAEQDRLAEIEAKKQAEIDLAIAEADRIKREAAEAAERAEREKQAAIEAEKQRAAKAEADRIAKESAEKAKAEKAAANKAHQKRVNREAMQSLIGNGFDEESAKNIITLIVKGAIKNVSINY